MIITLSESGMNFGEYDENSVYQIEASELYQRELKPNGIKTCEFILVRNNKLLFVEAKSSAPMPPQGIHVSTDLVEVKMKYNQYVQDIVAKMCDSLTTFASIVLDRHEKVTLPRQLNFSNFKQFKICFVLVIKSYDRQLASELKEKLNKEIRKDRSIWKIENFIVYTESMAQRMKLVLPKIS